MCSRPMSMSRCTRFASRVRASIRYGMGAIKGVGASAVEAIIEERERGRRISEACRIFAGASICSG